jgi:hypothetical protein
MYFNLLNKDSGAALQTVDRAIVVWCIGVSREFACL